MNDLYKEKNHFEDKIALSFLSTDCKIGVEALCLIICSRDPQVLNLPIVEFDLLGVYKNVLDHSRTQVLLFL